MSGPSKRQTWAVFDVDETLIRCKSMFAFLAFGLNQSLGAEAGGNAYASFTSELFDLARSRPREDVNRQFYRIFKGWRREVLDKIAEDWFAEEMTAGLFYVEPLAALREHQAQGHRIVLLSGSADFILAPIARHLMVDDVLAIHVGQTDAGMLTGEIEGIQTIGLGKRDALQAFMATRGNEAAPPLLLGYGDHPSDAAFLALCDQKTVILSNRDHLGTADWHRGWNTMRVTSPTASPTPSKIRA